MSLAACLLAYSMVVAVLGPPLLARATRSGAAPRAGVTAWAAAMGSVVVSWTLAAALLAARGAARGPGGAVVIDAEQPSVYCLAGRPATIVITSGALAVLDDAQLAAVLVHERAHLSGRHHQLLSLGRALAQTLPGMRLFTQGSVELARLAEMHADDAAARQHGPDTVVAALLALAAPGLVPAHGLGAAGLGVAGRVERLLFPPAAARIPLAAILAGLLIGPVIATALVITQSPLCIAALA